MTKLEEYRERAAECELLAKTARTPEIFQVLLYLSARWSLLANEIDEKSKEIEEISDNTASRHPYKVNGTF
jgi:hypothetical protein